MEKPIVIGEKGNEAKRTFVKATDADVAILETPTTRLEEDTGHGTTIIQRRFTFRLPPPQKDVPSPSDEELLHFHKGKILAFIWKDHLQQYGEMKLVRSKKKNHAFHILIPCIASSGHALLEKPQTINEIFSKK